MASPPSPQPWPSAPGLAPMPRWVSLSELTSLTAALQVVDGLRIAGRAQPALHQAVMAVKRVQCQRFRHTYADVLTNHDWSAAAQFFLQELYGDRDYSQRDTQFGRIAPAMQRLFPATVLGVATTLTRLHAMTEQFDYAMACALLALHPNRVDMPTAIGTYVAAWRTVGQSAVRAEQLALVQQLGTEIAQLTRNPGLRMMLRMMRGPASAAGLQDLQNFLELGFDTFAALHRCKSGANIFLATVDQRERAWMARLFQPNETNPYDPADWPELE